MVAPVTCAWHVHVHGMCMCMACAWRGVRMACAWRVHGVCMVYAWCYSGACAPQLQSEVTPLVVRLEAKVLVRLTRRRRVVQGDARCRVQDGARRCRVVQGDARCRAVCGCGGLHACAYSCSAWCSSAFFVLWKHSSSQSNVAVNCAYSSRCLPILILSSDACG